METVGHETDLLPIPAACSSKKMICESGIAMQHSCGEQNPSGFQLYCHVKVLLFDPSATVLT